MKLRRAKPITSTEKPPSSHSAVDGDVFKDDPNIISLEYEKIQLERERLADIEREREREKAGLEREKPKWNIKKQN